jgi:hypothetical protein
MPRHHHPIPRGGFLAGTGLDLTPACNLHN